MNVKNPELVIVRGINNDWLNKNFSELWIGFGGTAQATPKEDAFYVGLYLSAPVSAIVYIGIVDKIKRYNKGADFYLKSIIKLRNPIKPKNAIRKHENWNLSRLGLNKNDMDDIRNKIRVI